MCIVWIFLFGLALYYKEYEASGALVDVAIPALPHATLNEWRWQFHCWLGLREPVEMEEE